MFCQSCDTLPLTQLAANGDAGEDMRVADVEQQPDQNLETPSFCLRERISTLIGKRKPKDASSSSPTIIVGHDGHTAGDTAHGMHGRDNPHAQSVLQR
jgi:hypothetical protein